MTKLVRTNFSNAMFTSPTGGQLGSGDRAAWSSMPTYSGNPYDSNDFVFRWRQFVHLYETSWEARKIIRIIPEDALRKSWIIEDLPEEMAKPIQIHLERLRFADILKRSMMLERLLGGCLTFMGLDSNKDDPSEAYDIRTGSRLRFFNAIPVSRISKQRWDTNPLSPNYMRASQYMINGQTVDVSRMLVWDGDPLFDSYDFALTNFRANLAGFGPSKLAPLWDDIVRAVGARHASYQLIQMSNAIVAAVDGLQDLQATRNGKQALELVKDIANQIGLYRAAVIDREKVTITQQAASFGSVPELLLLYVQILSAGSDIPACRFLGQAPGGLSTDDSSGKENYYNVIDAIQHQQIEPKIRKVYDVVGYELFPGQWQKARDEFIVKFPPMWNQTELEEAQTATARLDNVMKLVQAGLMSDPHALEEINAKNILSVNLDDTDLQNLQDVREEQKSLSMPDQGEDSSFNKSNEFESKESQTSGNNQSTATKEVRNLRKSFYFKNADRISLLIKAAGYDPEVFDHEQFRAGYTTEQEHSDVTHGDPVEVAKIVLAHLTEKPDYYLLLKEYVENVTPTEELKSLFASLSTVQVQEVYEQWLKENEVKSTKTNKRTRKPK